MIPIVSIVGKSDSGKTTFIEKLIPELTRRGYRVATVKHDIHGFEVDREGKDSWRHKQAGAHTVVISSPRKLALIRDVEKDLTLAELRERLIQEVDIILSEGYKKDIQPKIEIYRKELHHAPLCTKEDNLIAIVSDHEVFMDVPRFSLEDIEGVADFIERTFLKQKQRDRVVLKVNGKSVSLKPFVEEFLSEAVKGMVRSLKGCESPKRIELLIES